MKRSGIKRTRSTPRRTTRPRCTTQRCKKAATNGTWCLTHATRRADTMMSKHVRELQPYCERCGATTALQWAHIFSRKYRSVRWSKDNYKILDARCHAYFTHHPAEWEQWCRDEGVDWDGLRVRALNDPPQDPLDIIHWLKGDGP